jgi:serine/threonine protein kinase
LELVAGMNMYDRMQVLRQVFSESSASTILDGCLAGLRCIHSMHITHRDLKPENLMFVTNDKNSPV